MLPGVVAGVGGWQRCLGLPNIGGEVAFDRSHLGNPLVNALCVGVLRHEDLHLAKATGAGSKVILYGASTGPDGIGGVSVLASETFDDDMRAERKTPFELTVHKRAQTFQQTPQRSGGRSVHGKAAHRVHAGDLRGGTCDRYSRSRRRRAVAPLQNWPAPVTAACMLILIWCRSATHAQPRRNLDERVARTHDGDRRA